MATAPVGQVIEALSALYSTPDPQAKKQANKWLANFQKQVQILLVSPNNAYICVCIYNKYT